MYITIFLHKVIKEGKIIFVCQLFQTERQDRFFSSEFFSELRSRKSLHIRSLKLFLSINPLRKDWYLEKIQITKFASDKNAYTQRLKFKTLQGQRIYSTVYWAKDEFSALLDQRMNFKAFCFAND